MSSTDRWRDFPPNVARDDVGLDAMREFFVENMKVFRHLSRTDPEHATDKAMAGNPEWTVDERRAWDGFIQAISDRPTWDRLPDYWQAFLADILTELDLVPPDPDGLHRIKGVTDQ